MHRAVKPLFPYALICCLSPATSFALQINVGPAEIVQDMQDREPYDLQIFPDSPLSAVRLNGEYYFFGSGFVNPGKPGRCQGTYRMKGDLFGKPELDPVLNNGLPRNVLPRETQPDLIYDRDYAGGGTVLPVDQDRLLYFYHSEYHWIRAEPLHAYTSISIAISEKTDEPPTSPIGVIARVDRDRYMHDGPDPDSNANANGGGYYQSVPDDFGSKFIKLGQIIRPNIHPETLEHTQESIWAGGGEVAEVGAYYYLYYTDRLDPGEADSAQDPCSEIQCITVARALKADVVQAATLGKASSWMKFYRDPVTGQEDFSEPGIGGKFTPIVPPSDNKDLMGLATVHFDSALGLYLMAHSNGFSGISLRSSQDGIHWSEAMVLDQVEGYADGTYNSPTYPALIGAGEDPQILGDGFWYYFTNFDYGKETGSTDPKHRWPYVSLRRKWVVVSSEPVLNVAQ